MYTVYRIFRMNEPASLRNVTTVILRITLCYLLCRWASKMDDASSRRAGVSVWLITVQTLRPRPQKPAEHSIDSPCLIYMTYLQLHFDRYNPQTRRKSFLPAGEAVPVFILSTINRALDFVGFCHPSVFVKNVNKKCLIVI